MEDVERLTKGPEIPPLPKGYAIHDKEGVRRERVRARWWGYGAQSWREVSMSVFNPEELPDTPLPGNVDDFSYDPAARPVFFGHYWLEGEPRRQAANALCLDYSAGLDGPLVTYTFEDGDDVISLERVMVHQNV